MHESVLLPDLQAEQVQEAKFQIDDGLKTSHFVQARLIPRFSYTLLPSAPSMLFINTPFLHQHYLSIPRHVVADTVVVQ